MWLLHNYILSIYIYIYTHFSEIIPFFAHKTFLKLYRPIVLRMSVRFLSLHHTLNQCGQQPRTPPIVSHHKILVKHLIFVVYLKMLIDVWLSKNPTNKNAFNSWGGGFESQMPHWKISVGVRWVIRLLASGDMFIFYDKHFHFFYCFIFCDKGIVKDAANVKPIVIWSICDLP